MKKTVEILRSIAQSTRYLHSVDLVHCDLKHRNIVFIGGKWKLIDLDASAKVDTMRPGKYSEAFTSPELEKVLLPERVNGRPSEGQTMIKAAPAQVAFSLAIA